jgi:cytochrome o ubiquinol oxidase subunit 2
MRFRFRGLDDDAWSTWVGEVRAAGGALDRAGYLALEKPSAREPVRRYAQVADDLFDAIVNRCVAAGTRCMRELATIDAHGGLGPTGRARLAAALGPQDICRPSETAASPSQARRPLPLPTIADFTPGLPSRDETL